MKLFKALKNIFQKNKQTTPEKEGLLSRSFDRPAKNLGRKYDSEWWLKVLRNRDASGKKISIKKFLKQAQIKEAIEIGNMDYLSKFIDWEKITPEEMDHLIKADCLNVNTYIDEHCHGSPEHIGHTPLSLAVEYENAPLVKYLLEHGADPNAELKSYGDSWCEELPVFFFAFKNPKFIDLFLEHGADPYARTYYVGHGNNYKGGMGVNNPILAAIRTNNLDALKKMTSASHDIPQWFLDQENLSTISKIVLKERGTNAPTLTQLYWESFVDQVLRKERKTLRGKLAQAQKEGNLEQKKEIIRKLTGKTDNGLLSQGEDPIRYAQVKMLKKIRKAYGSKLAISAHKAFKDKRTER